MNDSKVLRNWEVAINFVNARRPAVLGWARSRIWSLGFEPEDFIQEAYLAAMKALDVAERKGEPELFERCFWVTYKFGIAHLLKDPTLAAHPQSSHERVAKPEPDNHDLHQSAKEMEEALCVMAPREKLVWDLLLGETDCGKCTIAKVAEMFGVSSPRIRQIRDRGLARVRKHFLDHEPKPAIVMRK